MCGIVGWVGKADFGDLAQQRLNAMCDTILHRGPDDRGQFISGGVALGMQRLSIVDIAGGQQPMSSADGQIQIVFNGEIFNHSDLREAEISRGTSFQSRSDTEVILRLYERFGTSCVDMLNGMFAIAIWDGRQQTLHLFRDRLGVKPLYWRFMDDEIVFASEIKAILAACPHAGDTVNESAIWDYLTYRFVPGPQTIWNGIAKLPPGHRLAIRAGQAPEVTRYWDIPRPPVSTRQTATPLQRRFDELLVDATSIRMVADVPVGVMLSGGLDSSCVAAAAREAGFKLKTYSVAFRDAPEIDERPYARAVATHLGCDHHEVEIGPEEFIGFLPELVTLTDEPLADLASVPLYYVCKLARRDVKVVLSGEGSDEILGGYSFDKVMQQWQERTHGEGTFRRLIRQLTRSGLSLVDLRNELYPLVMTNYMTSEEKTSLLRGGNIDRDSLDSARDRIRAFGRATPLAQALYGYCGDWLVEDLLMKADRMSMGVSLELRTPFLDYRLVEFAATLPDTLRVGQDADGQWKTKVILRRFAERRLPREIIDRPKQGFPVPVYGWLSGELKGWANEMLAGPATRLTEWCKPAALTEFLIAGTQSEATMKNRHRLWNLLILELWMRRWR
ncbi:MAG: asparagine synthase (glutamine-hydrolyzing) [Alphaproteobacteria bacterium]|nr:asparagine synthase (glutamine-hydrolyzing) [Alphaproteobacteria bacterium]